MLQICFDGFLKKRVNVCCDKIVTTVRMGQIPQDRNFGQNVILFFLKLRLRVTKPDYISLIFQLILDNCVF